MASINQTPSYQNNGGHSGFDLSHRFAFSSTVGQLKPVFADELYPGDHIKLSADMFTRTEPLNKAAFTRVTEHIDYFFVPFTQLYSQFDAFIYSVDDIRTTFVDRGDLISYLPSIHPAQFLNVLQDLNDGDPAYIDPDDPDTVYKDYSFKDEFGEPALYNAQELLDCLGYGANVANYTAGIDNMPNLNPFRLAAYQKIWYDYYRLTDWTPNNPLAYNLDIYYSTGVIPESVIRELLTVRYRPWKKDYFTNVLPSPLVGARSLNVLPNIEGELRQWLSPASVTAVNQNGVGDRELPTTVAYEPTNITASLRTAFAYEKLLEITRRAGKHYDLQTLAHFGVKTPRRVDGDVFYLGSQSSVVQISDVVSTAETEQASLGEIGGKGYSSMNGNGIDFTANTHGIIMAIYSAVPESDYQHLGIDRQNTYLQKYDYFFPELDDLGMQPMFFYDFNFNPTQPADARNRIYGWQYRYIESKARYDQAHGKFITLQTGWLTYRNSWGENTPISQRFYISPNYLNPIMEVNYDMPGKRRASTDPLIHDLYWKAFKTSKMSTYGLPSL